ncbi:hypothetical protein F4804DRAFT_353311 [Jackrogersella minutella]|nr:hypothetical protein F4804DRAFT_353311 [Jackrogersella minutella]
MESIRAAKFRKAAKALANDRHQRKQKHRRVQHWIHDRYKTIRTTPSEQVDLPTSDSEGDEETALVPRGPRKPSFWEQPAADASHPSLRGVALGTMLKAAKHCYKLCALDLDTMGMYGHLRYIQAIVKPDDVPVDQTIVTKPLVAIAQHQQHLAERDFFACVAKLAGLTAMTPAIRAGFKTCANCFEKFRIGAAPCACDDGRCEYHPGNIRCWNDVLDESNKDRKLGADFLQRGNVTLKEFQLWMGTCYWDCCGGKLVEVDPRTLNRSQRHKRERPKEWEIVNEFDGKAGCRRGDRHVAIEA